MTHVDFLRFRLSEFALLMLFTLAAALLFA